jgi:Bacterial Ig-like domain (group 3)
VAQVGNRWPGTIFNADQLFSGVECAKGIGCYFYSFIGQWSFSFGTWSVASNGGCIESPDPQYTVDHIFEREVIPGRYATPVYEAVWESHYSLNLMERSIQQDVLPLQAVAFYLDAWDEVQGIASTTALVSSENPTFVGSSITFTATVTGSGATPTGAVTFRDGGSSIGSGNLNAGGVATFTTSALLAGMHSITAVYGGDATYAGSSSPPVAEDVRAIISAAYKVSPPVFGVH